MEITAKIIQTQYHGPTDTHGSFISAQDADGNSVKIAYPHELGSYEAHRSVMHQLCKKIAWNGNLACAPVEFGWTFVCVNESPSIWV